MRLYGLETLEVNNSREDRGSRVQGEEIPEVTKRTVRSSGRAKRSLPHSNVNISQLSKVIDISSRSVRDQCLMREAPWPIPENIPDFAPGQPGKRGEGYGGDGLGHLG